MRLIVIRIINNDDDDDDIIDNDNRLYCLTVSFCEHITRKHGDIVKNYKIQDRNLIKELPKRFVFAKGRRIDDLVLVKRELVFSLKTQRRG